MAYVAFKGLETAHELANALLKWGFAVVEGFDVDGNPTVTVGPDAAGTQSALIKILALPQIGFDVLGLAQNAYVPLKAQLSMEQLSGNTGTLVLQTANLSKIVAETLKWGTEVEFWNTANGTAPRVPVVGTDVLAATWYGNSLQYGQLAAS